MLHQVSPSSFTHSASGDMRRVFRVVVPCAACHLPESNEIEPLVRSTHFPTTSAKVPLNFIVNFNLNLFDRSTFSRN